MTSRGYIIIYWETLHISFVVEDVLHDFYKIQ